MNTRTVLHVEEYENRLVLTPTILSAWQPGFFESIGFDSNLALEDVWFQPDPNNKLKSFTAIYGSAPGNGPRVDIFDTSREHDNDGLPPPRVASFFVMDPLWRNGIHITRVKDSINGDNIVAWGRPGSGPAIRIFNWKGELVASRYVFENPNYRGGIKVAAWDTNNDGRDEILALPQTGGGGGPLFTITDYQTGNIIRSFFIYDPNDRSGKVDFKYTSFGVWLLEDGPPSAGLSFWDGENEHSTVHYTWYGRKVEWNEIPTINGRPLTYIAPDIVPIVV